MTAESYVVMAIVVGCGIACWLIGYFHGREDGYYRGVRDQYHSNLKD